MPTVDTRVIITPPKLRSGQLMNRALPGPMEIIHRVQYIYNFTRDEKGLVYLPTQLECTLQLYWRW
jgi:hypothetical protein